MLYHYDIKRHKYDWVCNREAQWLIDEITALREDPHIFCLVNNQLYRLECKHVKSIPVGNTTLYKRRDLDALHCGIQKCKIRENVEVKVKFYLAKKKSL